MTETMPATPWLDQFCECGHKRSSHSRDGRDGGLHNGGCLASFRPSPDGISRNDGCHALNIPIGKYPEMLTDEQRRRRERGW